MVVGAPICAESLLPKVVAEFESNAAVANERVCYLAAESRLESIYAQRSRYTKVLLGAQPVWQPSEWKDIIAKHKSLRAQLNRARNKGVKISECQQVTCVSKQRLLQVAATASKPTSAAKEQPN